MGRYVLLLGLRLQALYEGGMTPFAPDTSPVWGLSKSERCRHSAEILYELEKGFREQGWPSGEFVYDAEHDLHRIPDGEFAFSRKNANERRLREKGIVRQPA
jgi:hypothetical protein